MPDIGGSAGLAGCFSSDEEEDDDDFEDFEEEVGEEYLDLTRIKPGCFASEEEDEEVERVIGILRGGSSSLKLSESLKPSIEEAEEELGEGTRK